MHVMHRMVENMEADMTGCITEWPVGVVIAN